jgi:ankyrin repeat protein
MHNKINEMDDLQSVLKKYAKHPDFIGLELSNVDQPGITDDTALHIAARKGELDDVVALIRHGATVDLPGDMGNTALHFAAMAGKSDVVKVLLRAGANRNALNQFYERPLDVAKNGKHIAVIVTLRA